jgi:branched-chain amino acid transport system substrate-binding protein
LKTAGAFGVASAAGSFPMPAISAPKTIKIGFVTPQTGPLAAFAEPDAFVLEQFRKATSGGIEINGARHPVEFVVRDS